MNLAPGKKRNGIVQCFRLKSNSKERPDLTSVPPDARLQAMVCLPLGTPGTQGTQASPLVLEQSPKIPIPISIAIPIFPFSQLITQNLKLKTSPPLSYPLYPIPSLLELGHWIFDCSFPVHAIFSAAEAGRPPAPRESSSPLLVLVLNIRFP